MYREHAPRAVPPRCYTFPETNGKRLPMTLAAPKAQGLYDPQWEHDACGIGAVVNISGGRDHAIVEHGKQVLLNLMHRGAAGADESTGDGAGILLQVPHEFFAAEADRLGFALPAAGEYGVAMLFCPQDAGVAARLPGNVDRGDREGGAQGAWAGATCRPTTIAWASWPAPPSRSMRQVFIGGKGRRTRTWSGGCTWPANVPSGAWPSCCGPAGDEFYVPSMSCRTIVYKGMFLAPQLFAYYPDLDDRAGADGAGHRASAVQHQHVSQLAAGAAVPHDRPQRRDQHAARQCQPAAELREDRWPARRWRKDMSELFPILQPGGSDSACFDNCMELLVRPGAPRRTP